MRTLAAQTSLLIALVLASACEASESLPGPGLDMQVRVHGAQLQRGKLGKDKGGPRVTQVLRPQPEVERGEAGVKLNGRLGAKGVALHIQAKGDKHHWVVPAGGFDFVVDDELTWSADLAFSYAIQSERVSVLLQAADADGRLGPVEETTFELRPEVPPARLLVSLAWDAAVDLDLHVQLPDGTVVGAKNINSSEPVGGAVTPVDAPTGGFLDYDSNQQCELDLRNEENVVWLESEPPKGTYKVYAHLFSPCDASAVNFVAKVRHKDKVVAEASSTLLDFDSRVHPAPGDAPGLLLTEFKIP